MNRKLLFMGGALFIGLLMAEPASAARHGGRGGHAHHGGVHHRGVHVTRAHGWHAGSRVSHRHLHHYRAYRPYASPYRTIIADPWVAAATSSYCGASYGARYAAIRGYGYNTSRGYSGYGAYNACGPTYYPGYTYPYYNTYGCPAPVTCYTF